MADPSQSGEQSAVRSDPDAPRVPMPVNLRTASLLVLALTAVVFSLRFAQDVAIPIVLSILISYALAPMVTALKRWGLPRSLTAAVLLMFVVGGAGWVLYAYRHNAAAVVERIPEAAKKLREVLRDGRRSGPGPMERVQQAATELEKTAAAATRPHEETASASRMRIEEPRLNMTAYLWWGSMGALAAVGEGVVIVFLVYFMLVSGDQYKRKLLKIVGRSLTTRKITVEILEDINTQIERFILVQLFTSTVVALGTWAAFRWVGLEQAGVWGIAAGVLNSIPYFGPVVVAAGVAIVGFLQFGTLTDAGLLIALTLVIAGLEGYWLTPWLTSRAARMNAVAVFVGLLFWGMGLGRLGLAAGRADAHGDESHL